MKEVFFFSALSALYAVGAGGQSNRPDPADASTKGAPVEYRSVFESYRPFVEQEVGNWRKANDEVGEAGGHKAHAPAKPPAKPEAKGPAEKGHGGHK